MNESPEEAASSAMRHAVSEIRASGYTSRDAGMLLGISNQRIEPDRAAGCGPRSVAPEPPGSANWDAAVLRDDRPFRTEPARNRSGTNGRDRPAPSATPPPPQAPSFSVNLGTTVREYGISCVPVSRYVA
jgi:hypothetical protein